MTENNLLESASLWARVLQQRALSDLKSPRLGQQERTALHQEIGKYKELEEVILPYLTFAGCLWYYYEIATDAAEEGELTSLAQVKSFLRNYRKEVKAFSRAGGKTQMPGILLKFLSEMQSNPPQLKPKEKKIKLVNYVQEATDDPDGFISFEENFQSLSNRFSKVQDSSISNLVTLFAQVDNLDLDMNLPALELRDQIKAKMVRFDELLNS